MKIWIIDHYSVPVKYYPLARNTNFAKNLIKMGHEVIIFAASTVHNSKVNLIEDESKFKEIVDDEVKYVLIQCHPYEGNGLKRILNMYEFARKLDFVCNNYPKPDAIISTSMTLQACKKGIQIAQKYGCKRIAQVTDLWPETLIAYNRATKHHPIVIWFRMIEKWIYKKSDAIIFAMEGAYDYIVEQGWEKAIPREKVHFINNGVDLDAFDYNKEHYKLEDPDLNNNDIFKVIYTGSIRKVNNLGLLLDAAKHITDDSIRILIWGDGDELLPLKERIAKEKISNVVLKGKVDKKYIPYIVSCADLNVAHNNASEIFRFGISFNKIFDYMAAGKPILSDFPCKYNPAVQSGAGVAVSDPSPQNISKMIQIMKGFDSEHYDRYCEKAHNAACKYDFKNLSLELMKVIEASS